VVATTVFTLLMTWHKGREIVTANRRKAEGSLRDFIEQLGGREVASVSGVGVFLNSSQQTTPLALRANVEHNHVVHDHVIIVSVEVERVPHVAGRDCVKANTQIQFSGATGERLTLPAEGITGLVARFGFLDEPDIPAALRVAAAQELIPKTVDVAHASYFLSQITIVPTDAPGMSHWRKKLFLMMAHNAANPAEYFRLPDGQTVTMGGRIQL